MRVHRFYSGEDIKLKKDFWLHDEALLWQWNKVLRFREGQEVVLFDGLQTDRLYRIAKIDAKEAHLQLVTELERIIPQRNVYLLWSLLKRDKNDLAIQKGTELGISNFVPIISERSIRKEFNTSRAKKIAIEASEQCGRSTIPHVREPLHLEKALEEYQGKVQLMVCQQGTDRIDVDIDKVGLLIGPEGGWSSAEKELFEQLQLPHLQISDFVLRAETAAIAAAALVQ
jgi:16S rRNA (uracil1498-N3)-methyltransferase